MEKVDQKDSQKKERLAMLTQEDSEEETIKKVGLEKIMTIGEIIGKYYGDLTEAFNEEITYTLPEHRSYDCKIELEPDSSLYKGAIYPTSPKEEKALKEYIDENLAKGFISRSESPTGYPVLFVPRKSGELQLCMDYKKLNHWTKCNAYPIQRISAVFEAMKEEVVFSKFDLLLVIKK